MEIKVALGIPTAFTGVYNDDIFRAFMRIATQGWAMIETECGRIDVVRNQMAQEAINGGFTHLVMLDADHIHPFDTVNRLIRWAMKDPDRYQIVGGLQYRRCPPFEPQVFYIDKENGRFATLLDWPAGIVPVDLIGMASICIDVRVFDILKRPWWRYEYPEAITDFRYPSEDVYFSRTCRESGLQPWVDTTVTSPHLCKWYADKTQSDRYQRETMEGSDGSKSTA
jgi:hypothetical protein